MFYELEIKDYVRVPPKAFSDDINEAVLKSLTEHFEGYVSQELGFVVAVVAINEIGEGVIVPGDGAAYYDTKFKVLTYKPEMQEVVIGRVSDITDFGAFIDIGPVDGMIHISQTMDDYVSFSKDGVLQGKETKKVLKVNDVCIARIIAISYKDPTSPKVALTMRQPFLGALSWIEEESKKETKEKKTEKVEKKKK